MAKMFKKSKRAGKFNSSKTLEFKDEMFDDLSGAHKLIVMLAEASGVTVKMADYKGTLYVSRECVTEVTEKLGLI
jgi:hypothetical protein